MPIGTSKIGVLGAGTVPGGCQTFNASGTFSVPPGVSKVNITGKGGTGNPGNAGNAGNSGNSGNGGAAGAGGTSVRPCCCGGYIGQQTPGWGGFAYACGWPGTPAGTNLKVPVAVPGIGNWYTNSGAPPTWSPAVRMGGYYPTVNNPGANNPRNNSQSGNSGNAGTAGTAGNPGNAGNASSGLCKTFNGGAGGNAGVGGAAGNGGSGGTGGGSGGNWCNRSGGSAGNGAGAGGSGLAGQLNPGSSHSGAGGGGGAGVANDGNNGANSTISPSPQNVPQSRLARGGNCPAISLNWPCASRYNQTSHPAPPSAAPPNMIGGMSGGRGCVQGFSSLTTYICICAASPAIPTRANVPQFGLPSANQWRSGGGGGGAGTENPICRRIQTGGGGGGGGRGALGNAGGNSSAPSGSAATPSTFNCVPVTPGGSYPITVASPGGQVVISWNPQ